MIRDALGNYLFSLLLETEGCLLLVILDDLLMVLWYREKWECRTPEFDSVAYTKFREKSSL